MGTVLIGCETLRNELELALSQAPERPPVVWVESGLHNVPAKLRARLQQELDALSGVRRVLLAFGFCGNAAQGLRAGDFELVIPRVDDCISLLLGSMDARRGIKATYFFTPGWLSGETNIWSEYQYTLKKYGEARAKMIYGMMLGNYTTLGVLNTGAYDLADFTEKTAAIARDLGLEQKILSASAEYLVQLLRGPWPPERFLTVPPRGEVTARDIQEAGHV